MEGVIEMLDDFKRELEQISKKSKFPWINIYRKHKKIKFINTKARYLIRGCYNGLNYDNARNLAVLYHNIKQEDTISSQRVFVDPKDSNEYIYTINRAIIGDRHTEFEITLIPNGGHNTDDNLIARTNRIRYWFLFSQDHTISITRKIYFRNNMNIENSILHNRSCQDSLTSYYYEYHIFKNTVIDYVLYLIRYYMES